MSYIERAKQRGIRTLRWSERYLKTDMVYLMNGSFWLTLGRVGGSLLAFGSSIAFANLLPAELYGQYRFVLAAMNLLSIPTLAGISDAVMRAATHNFDGTLRKGFKTRFAWGLWGMIASFVVAIYYLWKANYALAIDFTIIAFFVPLFFSLETYSSYLFGKKLFRESTIYSVISAAVSTVFLIIALFYTDNVALLLTSYFLPYTIVRAFFFFHTLKKHVGNNNTDIDAVKYGKHLSFMYVINAIENEADKLFLWYFAGPVQVAVYALARAPVNQFNIIKGALWPIVFPKAAVSEITNIKKSIYDKLIKLSVMMVCIWILYVIFAPKLYELVFPKYLDSILYSQVYSLTLLFFPFLILLKTTFTAQLKVREQYYLSFLSLARIILFLIFVPKYGIWGIIIPSLAVDAVVNIARLIMFHRMK